MCLSYICLLAIHTLICVTFSLPPGAGGWLRLLLVALPGLFTILVKVRPKAASHIDWNSHSVSGLHLFMFHYIILTFDCNVQRTRLSLSILFHIRLKSSSKNKRWKISAAHRLKITHGNTCFILIFVHTRPG